MVNLTVGQPVVIVVDGFRDSQDSGSFVLHIDRRTPTDSDADPHADQQDSVSQSDADADENANLGDIHADAHAELPCKSIGQPPVCLRFRVDRGQVQPDCHIDLRWDEHLARRHVSLHRARHRSLHDRHLRYCL